MGIDMTTVRQRRAATFGKYALAVLAGAWVGVMIGTQHRAGEIAALQADRWTLLHVLAEQVEGQSLTDRWAVYEQIESIVQRAGSHQAWAEIDAVDAYEME